MARPRLSEEKIRLIRDLAAKNLSLNEIARRAHVSPHSARKYSGATGTGQEQKLEETILAVHIPPVRLMKDFLTIVERLYDVGDINLMSRYEDLISVISGRTRGLIDRTGAIYGLRNDLDTVIKYFELKQVIEPVGEHVSGESEGGHIPVNEAVERWRKYELANRKKTVTDSAYRARLYGLMDKGDLPSKKHGRRRYVNSAKLDEIIGDFT